MIFLILIILFLSFLDPNEVSYCFVDDVIMSEIPDDPTFQEYADYLV